MTFRGIRYPIGVQSFEKLRRENYLYIDKTHFIPDLLSNSYYFLSRPRRFGKSLFLSMLEAYFKGKKELFEGLAIAQIETEWKAYPVIHLDFASLNVNDTVSLEQGLRFRLGEIARDYEIDFESLSVNSNGSVLSLSDSFGKLITELYERTGSQVVILIDEYDKGIIELIDDEDEIKKTAKLLSPFFSVLKSYDPYIHFAFVTGVSRFRNTTIFSGFNNPIDLSLDPQYATILGVTSKEIDKYFSEAINKIAEVNGYDYETAKVILKNKYDGYRFTRIPEYVYNPFSLMNVARSGELEDYWVMSGSSRILVNYLKKADFDIEDMISRWVSSTDLSKTFSTDDPLSLLFQTGYLTITDFDEGFYKLGIPNQEVQAMLTKILIPEYVKGINKSNLDLLQRNLKVVDK